MFQNTAQAGLAGFSSRVGYVWETERDCTYSYTTINLIKLIKLIYTYKSIYTYNFKHHFIKDLHKYKIQIIKYKYIIQI